MMQHTTAYLKFHQIFYHSYIHFTVNLDFWLENQIIIAKNSLERAKLNIDRYFTARTLCPEVFEKRDMLNEGMIQAFDNL